MKRIKKLALGCGVMLLSAFFLFGCIGCGAKVENTETDLQIYYWNSGLGLEFMNNAIAKFEDAYPQYNVAFDYNSDMTAITNTFGLGAEYDTVDLYMFPVSPLSPKALKESAEPLNDILETTLEGESRSIGEKYKQNIVSALASDDGNYYNLSYGGGYCGIVYDKAAVANTSSGVPNTTDELELLVMELDSNGVVPFMQFFGGGYWFTVYQIWEAQYEGLDYYLDTFRTLGGGEKPDKDILLAADWQDGDGRLQAMRFLEKIVTPDYVYNGSNGLTFTEAQTLFLNGKAALMANGSWLMNEMSQNPAVAERYAMMKTPVLSSIIYRTPSIADDTELSAVITAVDAAASADAVALTGPGYEATAEDIAVIYEARNMMFATYDDDCFIVPNYATAKQAAKDFIKFFYSDESLRDFCATTRLASPLNFSDGSAIDTSNWSEWEKQQLSFTDTAVSVYARSAGMSPVFLEGGCLPYGDTEFITIFSSRNPLDRKTADECWDMIKSHHESQWETYLRNAQIS